MRTSQPIWCTKLAVARVDVGSESKWRPQHSHPEHKPQHDRDRHPKRDGAYKDRALVLWDTPQEPTQAIVLSKRSRHSEPWQFVTRASGRLH